MSARKRQPTTTAPLWVDDRFDGGNIEVVDLTDPGRIDLRIKPDGQSGHIQWFYFRMLGAKNTDCTFRITNAGAASYPEAWPDGSIVCSFDQKRWFRRPTQYKDGVLTFDLACENDVVYVALSPPFCEKQHFDLINRALSSNTFSLFKAVSTVEGRHIEILQAGSSAPDAKTVWIIARQHPGEPMGAWFIDGLIDKLVQNDNAAADVLSKARILLVPNMNPDGSSAGHLRTNAAGVDLNRAWLTPDPETSPEVHSVRQLMHDTGVDLFLDIHGDEEFRFVFAAGCEGNPSFTSEHAAQDVRFRKVFRETDPNFSTGNGYPPEEPKTANLSIACNYVGETFGCLALTIEMPFKDNAEIPDPVAGWGIAHSQNLGAAVIGPIADFVADDSSTAQ